MADLETAQRLIDLLEGIQPGELVQALADMADSGEKNAARVAEALRQLAEAKPDAQVLEAINALRAELAERSRMELVLSGITYDEDGRMTGARIRREPREA